MRRPSNGRLRHRLDALRRQFLRQAGLPLADVPSADGLHERLGEIEAAWNDRIYTPPVAVWVFLGQVLNADQSRLAAVARLVADQKLPECDFAAPGPRAGSPHARIPRTTGRLGDAAAGLREPGRTA